MTVVTIEEAQAKLPQLIDHLAAGEELVDEFMHRGIVGNDFVILPIEPRHTSLLTTLPLHHKDPFDRLLVAQARIENMAIVSADNALDAYGVQRAW